MFLTTNIIDGNFKKKKKLIIFKNSEKSEQQSNYALQVFEDNKSVYQEYKYGFLITGKGYYNVYFKDKKSAKDALNNIISITKEAGFDIIKKNNLNLIIKNRLLKKLKKREYGIENEENRLKGNLYTEEELKLDFKYNIFIEYKI